jgi:hypothetical protein
MTSETKPLKVLADSGTRVHPDMNVSPRLAAAIGILRPPFHRRTDMAR